jgi:hypothetical protein
MDRRIGFVILRTGRSPSVAPHAGISPTQSLWLPGGELLPEADLHRSGCATRRRTRARRSLARRFNDQLLRYPISKKAEDQASGGQGTAPPYLEYPQ